MLLSLISGADADLDGDLEADIDLEADTDLGAGAGWVDMFSVRTIFLFAAFFGLCGVLLPLANITEIVRLMISLTVGLTVGAGGNYFIKRIGYAHISSEVNASDLKGRTANVIIPFGQSDIGKISLVAKGQRVQFKARGFESAEEEFNEGDEVVVVAMAGAVAEVLKA